MTSTIGSHDVHPAAELFPLLEGHQFDALVADIEEHGQRIPVMLTTLPDPSDPDDVIDVVLDGRNRYRACIKAGVRPHFEYYRGTDPVQYVVSTNLHRRHLDESQRAMVAAKIAKLPHGGARQRAQEAKTPLATPTQAQAATMLNVSERSVRSARAVQERGTPELAKAVEQGRVAVSTAATLVEMPAAKQREIGRMSDAEILAESRRINAERKNKRRVERNERIANVAAQNKPLDGGIGLHAVIYADPPWKYEGGTTDPTREIENHYPPMPLADICALPVADITTPDAILYLWTTAPKLEEAFEVIRAWGFVYRTNIVWHKTGRLGLGYWARIDHEHLLVATKGVFPTPDPATTPRSVIASPVGKHSAKPHEFAELIERMFPALPRLEMFCRSPRQGWTVWGNQSADELAL
jgi:N6-adenosine-specific RNA methylase IME4